MGFELAGLVCGCGGAVAAVLVAASLLRMSVSVTNKFVGPAKEKARVSGGVPEWDWDDWDDEYTTPARRQRTKGPIPEPGIITCATITFATAVVFVLGCIVLTVIAEEALGLRMWRDESKLAVVFLNLPVAGLMLTVLMIVMLPTTFWRAAMVTFVYGLVLLAITVFIGAVVFVIGLGLG
jgi:hypothetical protein